MKHLTIEQRYKIEALLSIGKKQTEIASVIGKNKSVICRELKRNSQSGEYMATRAHKTSTDRERLKRKRILFTDEIKEYVKLGLRNDLSPEQIKGNAVKENKDCIA